MKNKILKTILAIIVWFICWMSVSGITNFPSVSDWLIRIGLMQEGNSIRNFTILTIWMSITGIIAFLLWYKYTKDVFFLKQCLHKKILYLYIIPFILLIITIAQGTKFGVPGILFGTSMIVNAFTQDVLTFGLLQTYLEKVTNNKMAALLTAVVFYIGHFDAFYDIRMSAVYIVGFILFGWLRYKFKTIYPGNIIHLSFLLLPV